MNRVSVVLTLMALVMSSVLVSVASGTDYVLTALNPIQNGFASADGISPNGQYVTGRSPVEGGYAHAVRYRLNPDGSVGDRVVLGTLMGLQNYSNGSAVSNDGTVYGTTASLFQGFNANRGFYWQNGVMTELPTFGGRDGVAYAVNASGRVAGGADNSAGGTMRAAVWNGGIIESVSVPGVSQSIAHAINDGGVTAGFYRVSNPIGIQNRAIYVCGPVGGVTELGFGTAYGINNAGDVVGTRWFAPGAEDSQAFVWRNGVMENLGVLGLNSRAADINDAGLIVGSMTSANDVELAYMWQNGVKIDLNSVVQVPAGWYLRTASAVSDDGRIVGVMHNVSLALEQGFVITPVPAPGTMSLLGCMLFVCRRSRSSRMS